MNVRSIVVLLALSSAAAKGPVEGLVVDSSGAPIAGVKVTLACRAVPPVAAVTSFEGRFHFPPPATDPCRLKAARRGFRPLDVPLDNSGPIRLELALQQLHSSLTVTAEPLKVDVDPAANIDTIEADAEMFAALPIMDQNYVGFMAEFLDAGVTATAGYSLIVDGAETSGLGVSQSAIREIKINKNPYSAEYYSPGRGRIEVRTEQGATQFHGEFNLRMRDYRLDARNAFADSRAPYFRRRYEGHFTGPLTRDGRTTFVLSAEYDRDDDFATVYAYTTNGVVRGQLVQPERDKEFSIRVSRHISDSRSFSLRYEYEDFSERNKGVGGFDLPETAADETGREHDVLFTHQAVFQNRILSESRLRIRDDAASVISRLHGVPRIVVKDAFTSGGAQDDRIDEETEVEAGQIFSFTSGRHHIRTGAIVADLDRRRYEDLTDRDGVFRFASLDDYLAGRPYSYTRQAGDGRISFWRVEAAGFIQDDWRPRRNLSLGLGLRYEYRNWPSGPGNAAPRFSIAWAPGDRRNTVIRAGAGLFYDRMGTSTIRDVLLLDGDRLRRFVVTDPSYPEPLQPGVEPARIPMEIVRLHPRLTSPLLLTYSVGVERSFGRRSSLAVTYNGVRGWRMFRSADANAPVPPDFLRPDPSLATAREVRSDARMVSHALNLSWRLSFKRRFEGRILYSLSRTENNTGGIRWIPPFGSAIESEWARAGHHRTHRFRSYGVLHAGSWFDIGLVLRIDSGRPYSIVIGRDVNRDSRADERPPGIPRNSMTGPGAIRFDVRLSKQFDLPVRLGEERRPELRLAIDAFNALNHVNYAGVVGNLSSPFFGRPVAARDPRRLQFSLQLQF